MTGPIWWRNLLRVGAFLGKYRLEISTGVTGFVFGRGDFARLRISRTANVPVSDNNTVDLGSRRSAELNFNLPCSEQGVQISNARFEHNSARLGGALGVSTDRTTNSFFNITSSTFISNTAIMKGGAIHVSGSRSGAFLSGGCVFRNNHVSATLDSYDGKSSMRCMIGAVGCISVEYGAGLHLRDATSTGHTVMASDGDGGFLCARFADQILLQNVNISKASSGKEGGGGALAVYATKIALDLVEIRNCSAGTQGGGGILLSGETKADLIGGCFLSGNKASAEFGGNVRLAASSLNVHGNSSNLMWPASEPVFPDEMKLDHTRPTTITRGVARSGGGIFCMGSAFPNKGVHLGTGTIVSLSFANGDSRDEGGGGISTVLCDVRLNGASIFSTRSIWRRWRGGGTGRGRDLRSQSAVSQEIWLCRFRRSRSLRQCHGVDLSDGTRFETTWHTDTVVPLAF